MSFIKPFLMSSLRRSNASGVSNLLVKPANSHICSSSKNRVSLFHSLSPNNSASRLQLGSSINSKLVLNGSSGNICLLAPRSNTIAASNSQLIQVRGMASKRHKKIIKMAKGLRGRANRCYTIALPRVLRMLRRQYIGRKLRKRDYRRLWITRINASSRMYGMGYRHFIHGMSLSNCSLNRKVLADLAVSEPLSFRSVVELAKHSKTIHGSWPLKEKKKITFSHFLTGEARYGPRKVEKIEKTEVKA